MTSPREMIPICPVCGKSMTVCTMSCEGCESELRGRFVPPKLARLPGELQDVIEVFLRCRGNIKDVERELRISYPTVSKKLDAINLLLAEMESPNAGKARILRQVQAGEMSAADAVRLLREQSGPKES